MTKFHGARDRCNTSQDRVVGLDQKNLVERCCVQRTGLGKEMTYLEETRPGW
jgi:hypothetical protein